MRIQWKDVLKEVVRSPKVHGRFLNTISLMEYIGARKIVKSQLERNIDQNMLMHMNEEIRHAQTFKKMALKVSGGELTTYDDHYLIAANEARAYLQCVDRSVESALDGEDSVANYLLSTLLIEERANEVYPFYAQLMEPLGYASYIKNILKEEEFHLMEVLGALKEKNAISSAKLSALRMIESQAFQQLIEAIAHEMQMAPTISLESNFFSL